MTPTAAPEHPMRAQPGAEEPPSPVNPADPVIIIGAGPAGLTVARELSRHGRRSIVLEKDSQVGGLAKTVRHHGYAFDIGGHRFFTKIDRVERTWREVLPSDFIRVPRLSRIFYRKRFFHYPLKPWNALAGLGIFNSLAVLCSYAAARIRPLPREDFFDQYITNRFGKRLYEIFFKTYTEKVWGIPCSEIRADWAAQRIKGLSLLQAVASAFLGERGGKVKSLIEAFDYPRLGPGQLWEAMADQLVEAGTRIEKEVDVIRIDHNETRITAVTTAPTNDLENQGAHTTYHATTCISSMPLRTLLHRLHPAPPKDVIHAADALRYRDFMAVNLILAKDNLFPDNWIYVHSPEVRVGRIQNFGNWSRDLVPEPHRTSIGMEYFCFEDDDLWSMSDKDLVDLAGFELETLGLAKAGDVVDGFVLRVKKAYPMYNGDFARHLEVIRQYLARFQNLQLIGRNGLHKYNNQDHSMVTAYLAAENILFDFGHDIWQVNSDSEYQEIKREPVGAPLGTPIS